MRLSLAFAVALPFVWLAGACSSGHSTFGDDPDGSVVGNGVGNGSTSSGGGSLSSSGSSGSFGADTDGATNVVNSGPCKGGHYTGTFAGTYTSHLTGIGFPIPVTGNVDMDLDQQGGADMTCHPAGEIPVPCNEVFTLSNGTITGVADAIGDAGGFPYFCSMTGTLDCASRRLDEGWIQCTYCVGPLEDSGTACQLFDGVLGTTGVGGHFAGPLTANYDISLFAFVMGTWNGAEALAGNDGGSPGPDGGPISAYLSDAGYLGPNDFGGLGTWNATWRSK